MMLQKREFLTENEKGSEVVSKIAYLEENNNLTSRSLTQTIGDKLYTSYSRDAIPSHIRI